ncbi:MAG: hypothetical protein R3F41_07875 [Gammaproteobacteria bacterium]|nr:hypothetical protein [Pseudomonadales bacterium]
MIRKVHQVVFGDLPQAPVTGYAKVATASVRAAFPSCEYRCWNLTEAENFVAKHFNSAVRNAFQGLRPFAYKGDLFKYCLLYVVGGWYIDAGVRMLVSPESVFTDKNKLDFVLFRSTGLWDAPWNCSLAFLYAAPGSPVFLTAIKEVIRNYENRYYGTNPLCPTMTVFGRAVAIHNVNKNIKIGQVVDVKDKRYRRGFALPPLGLVGLRKPTHAVVGNVADIGIPGSNSYVELWKERNIYS